jgi:peptidoglycan DL-endopeptidase CwlO
MPVSSTRVSRSRRLLVAGMGAAALASVAMQSPASAAPTTSSARPAAAAASSLGARAVRLASQQRGRPFVYGAAGPRAFDCSGLVTYVYGRLGRRLPHNAAAQYRVTRHVSHRSMRLGDLVFVDHVGHISHVGIYAGAGTWWVARHTGTTVTRQRIYTSAVVVGRVR